MIDSKLNRVAVNECDFPHCHNAKLEGARRCGLHGGNFDLERANKAAIRSYHLLKWKQEVDRFASSDTVKSLREEIGIARMTLQAIINRCQDEFDLQVNAPKISIMLLNIEKLVVSCSKLEDKLGFVLDKSATINLAEQIVQIVGEFVQPDDFELMATKIADAIINAGRVPIDVESRVG